MALEADIPVKVFSGNSEIDEASTMDDESALRMMADRNPEQLKMILQEVAAEQNFRKGNAAKVVNGSDEEGFMNMDNQPTEEV
jgi:hypothetical protein